MKNTKRLVLVDGSSYLFRAYYAMPALSSQAGHPTGALYGVVNMLKKLMAQYESDYFAVVFDAPGKTFREDLYPDYKANRSSMPEELQTQIAPLYEIIKAMGLPLICVSGVEADDVIGTLTALAQKKGVSTLVSTGDKDLAQLVSDTVTLVNTMTGEVLTPEGVLKKFGVTPDQMVDYLTLVGDSVDNIPGVTGVGPKTAVKWLQTFGSLNAIRENKDSITGKVGENLRAALDNLSLTRKLVTLVCDVPTVKMFPAGVEDVFEEALKQTLPNREKLSALFQQYEFKHWQKELSEEKSFAPVINHVSSEKHYETLLTKQAFDQWFEKIKSAPLFAFDTETTSLNPLEAKLVGLSFCYQAGHAVYIPLLHDYENAPNQIPLHEIFNALNTLLTNGACKIGHNLKFDCRILSSVGIFPTGVLYDTLLESYVLNSTGSRHNLDALALKYLDHKTTPFEEVSATNKRGEHLTFNKISLEKAGPYAAEDAEVTYRLHALFWPKLEKCAPLKKIFETIEMPLMPVLARMEQTGVLIDKKQLNDQSQALAKSILALEEQATLLAGEPFNLSSPKQLQGILFDKLKLPIISKTPTGQASTAEEVLTELSEKYELPKVILEYRTLSKLKSTYTDALPLQINPTTHRVHTSYHQAVTATGRLSSSDPNLQNIPVKTEAGRKIRHAFIAPPHHKIISADYSQIELRIMAHLSEDRGLLEAFAKEVDIHQATAAEVFGVPCEKVTSLQRRHAKAINFGLIYGMSAFGLAKQLGVERKAAEEYMALYFSRYPGVKNYMENTRAKAREQGFVETVLGRRLYLPEINAKNMQRRQAAERAAINAPMQGTAADIIKIAMIKMDAWINASRLPIKMTMQVHDELVFEVRTEALSEARLGILDNMITAADLKVPLVVDIGEGQSWDEAH